MPKPGFVVMKSPVVPEGQPGVKRPGFLPRAIRSPRRECFFRRGATFPVAMGPVAMGIVAFCEFVPSGQYFNT